MESQAMAKELLTLERRFWQALKDKDVETALSLTDAPCIVAGAQGIGSIDAKAFRSMMENATYTIRSFELDSNAQVRMLGDDIAILAYKVHEELTVDGKPVAFDAADTSTWVRRNGSWRCAVHTESLQGDPFGR